MFIEDELPAEFYALTGSVSYVHRVSDNEFHSSCPNCKGEVHDDGSWPNRFVMWRESRLNGEPFALCRRCGWHWSSKKNDALWTPEEKAAFEAKKRELEAQRAAHLHELIRKVMDDKYYVRYHDQMTEVERAYWEKRGIPQEWQDYLQLGFLPHYTVHGLTSYSASAYTIPVFTLGGQIENIKLRVSEPKDSNDRYRNLYKSGMQHLYVPHHELEKMPNIVVAVEGEIKATVIQAWGNLPDTLITTGWQSKSPEQRILDMYKDCELIYLALDPDAYVPDNKVKSEPAVIRSAKKLGIERVRLIVPPCDCKFDDAILQGYRFQNALNMAIKPQAWKYWS